LKARYDQLGNHERFELTAGTRWTQSSTGMVFKLLASSSGATDLAVDGSTASAWYRYTCPASREVWLERVNIVILDPGIEPDRFGGSSAVTNGLEVRTWTVASSSVILDFTDGNTILNNSDWGLLAGPDTPIQSVAGGARPDQLTVRWTIGKSGAALKLTSGQALEFLVQDDLTGLDSFKAMVQGITRSTT